MTSPRFQKKKKEAKEAALNDIYRRMKEASNIVKKDVGQANRYVHLVRRVAMKHKIRLPREVKRKICRHCYAFLYPGITGRVRLTNHKVVLYCNLCKKYTRISMLLRRNKRNKKALP